MSKYIIDVSVSNIDAWVHIMGQQNDDGPAEDIQLTFNLEEFPANCGYKLARDFYVEDCAGLKIPLSVKKQAMRKLCLGLKALDKRVIGTIEVSGNIFYTQKIIKQLLAPYAISKPYFNKDTGNKTVIIQLA